MSCCCLNICCVLPQQNKYYSTKRTPNHQALSSTIYKTSKNWMRYLNDDLLISEMNIPGTHESMALFSYYGLSVTVCQRWKLIDQLNSGIRFFDIRVKEDKDGSLPIFHHTAFQNTYLESDIIDVFDSFLTENPSEFIIMMIRIEAVDSGAPSLSSGFDAILNNKRQNLFTFDNWVPSISSIRGKIWLWPGVNWNYKGFSIKAKQRMGWLIRQDNYTYSLPDKKKCIKDTYLMAVKNKLLRKQGKEIYINQMNGVKWYYWPSVYASEINKYVYENEYYEGIVLFDFPGEDLIKKVIESNFIKKQEDSSSNIINMLDFNKDTDSI